MPDVKDPVLSAIATCFGCGRLPGAPGTWASLAALPLAWMIASAGGFQALVAATVAVFTLGTVAAHDYAERTRTKDPGEVVIDEVAGQWVTLWPVAQMAQGSGPDWRLFAVAFLAFRLFDIWKPWPVARIENLPGGLGIMADDIVAAMYASFVTAFAAQILFHTAI